uniref:Uncharacterized protein n=1 Tax=Arundo donax TaxID=35708 RepID=A0A0A8ZPE1_ARUDO
MCHPPHHLQCLLRPLNLHVPIDNNIPRYRIPQLHSIEQLARGINATSCASIGRHHGVAGRNVPERHFVEQVSGRWEVAGGGVEMQERVGGVGRRREEEAAAEELRVEGESGGKVELRGRGRGSGGE